jgi:hypothetical protein
LDKVFKKFQSLEELSSFVKNNDENDFLEYKSSSILFSKDDKKQKQKRKNNYWKQFQHLQIQKVG